MNIYYGKHLDIKEIKIGIEILRIYLSFLVVNTHCFKFNNNIKYNIILIFLRNRLHSPSFFIISFFFFYKTLISRNLDKYKRRLQKLLIPYIVWPLIIWIINNIYVHYFNIELKHSFEDLTKQLLAGHCFIEVFWFQWDLIYETFLFILIELVFHNYKLFILIYIELIAYFLQYSQFNYKLFSSLNFEIKYTFGRFIEIIPYSISGFIFAYFKLIERLKTNRIRVFILFLLIFILIYKYFFINEPFGFGYTGIKLHILSICIFTSFSIISNKIFTNNLIKTITLISNFTPGIYYLHIPIMLYFQNFIIFIKNKKLYGSLFIYITCYFICLIGNFFLKKQD